MSSFSQNFDFADPKWSRIATGVGAAAHITLGVLTLILDPYMVTFYNAKEYSTAGVETIHYTGSTVDITLILAIVAFVQGAGMIVGAVNPAVREIFRPYEFTVVRTALYLMTAVVCSLDVMEFLIILAWLQLLLAGNENDLVRTSSNGDVESSSMIGSAMSGLKTSFVGNNLAFCASLFVGIILSGDTLATAWILASVYTAAIGVYSLALTQQSNGVISRKAWDIGMTALVVTYFLVFLL